MRNPAIYSVSCVTTNMSPVFHGSWRGVTWDAREASRPMSLQGKLGFSRRKQSWLPRGMVSQKLECWLEKNMWHSLLELNLCFLAFRWCWLQCTLLEPNLRFQMWNPRPSLVSLFDAFLPNDVCSWVCVWDEEQACYCCRCPVEVMKPEPQRSQCHRHKG